MDADVKLTHNNNSSHHYALCTCLSIKVMISLTVVVMSGNDIFNANTIVSE